MNTTTHTAGADEMNQNQLRQRHAGFTLIEILIAIVLVGILSAVAVVGISSLVGKGTKSACQASADSAKAASAVYFGDNQAFPTTLVQLTTAGTSGAPLTLPSGVTAVGNATTGASWTMTMTAGTGGASPTFACT